MGPEESTDLLSFMADLRLRGAREIRCLPMAPGDSRGLVADIGPFVEGAVCISDIGDLLIVEGTEVRIGRYVSVEPAESLRGLARRLGDSLELLTQALEDDRVILPIRSASTVRSLRLPQGFSAEAARLASTASSALEIADLVVTQTIDRDLGGAEIRQAMAHTARIAREAISAVISTRTLVGAATDTR